jgi:hypothetical protein
MLSSLIKLHLLLQPGVEVGRLSLALNFLADHLAVAEQFERLEARAL